MRRAAGTARWMAVAAALGAGTLGMPACTGTGAAGGARLDAGRGDGAVTRSKTRVAPGQNGLEVVTWQVTDDGERMAKALRAHGVPAVAAADELALRANGFLLWPVRASELDALMSDLGGSAMDMRTWMGAAPTWRELAVAQAGDALVEVNGIARERPGATVRLMARSWPVPMEDGGRIAVNLVPQIVMNANEASLVRNGERLAGELVRSCAMELEMDRDVAWVVTCDPSGIIELELPGMQGVDAPGTVPATSDGGVTKAPPSEPAQDGTGGPGADGATAAGPEPDAGGAPASEGAAAPEGTQAPASAPPAPGSAPAPANPPVPANAPAPAQAPPPANAAPARDPAAVPPLAPAPREKVPPRPRKPIDSPPMEAPKRAPSTAAAHRALAFAALAMAQVPAPPASAPVPVAPPPPSGDPAPPVERDPPKSGKMTPRVATLGAALLLASPERAGMPARRTLLILVPHLDAMPFPDDASTVPMTTKRPRAGTVR